MYILREEHLTGMIEKVIQRMGSEVPEDGDFREVREFIDNPYDEDPKVGKYALCVYKMPTSVEPDTKIRYVEAAAYVPSGEYKCTSIVESGTKAELLAIMQTPEFIHRLILSFMELRDAFYD